MTDVFVNYRRDDGVVAGWLNERLEKEFDVFIDNSIQSGDSLDRHIMPVLNEAQIILAVIGKTWIEPRNLKRLHDSDDWVRRELCEAFARTDARVIPVLADVDMPDKKELPDVLHALPDLLAAELRYNSWDQDVERLSERIATLLARPRRVGAARGAMPAELPYLCNRVEQEDDLTALAEAAQATHSLFCVLHGHKWEAHAGFVSRLRQRGVLEDLFGAAEINVDLYPLEWNRSLAKAGNHAAALCSAIKSGAMKTRRASDEQLYAFLRNPQRPAVMMLQVTWEDLREQGDVLLPGFEKAWHALIAALGTTPSQFLALWLNLTYDTAGQSLPPGLAVAPLKELNPVREADIQGWMNLPEVRRFTSGRELALTNLASDQSLWMAPGRIHMQQFVDAVRALVASR
jgi:hypothetical protein